MLHLSWSKLLLVLIVRIKSGLWNMCNMRANGDAVKSERKRRNVRGFWTFFVHFLFFCQCVGSCRCVGCFGINVGSVCRGAVTLTTLLWLRFSILLCLYNLCTDTFWWIIPSRRKYVPINNSHPPLHFLWQPPHFCTVAQNLSKKLL